MVYFFKRNVDEPGFECTKAIFVFGVLNVGGADLTVDTSTLFDNVEFFAKFAQAGVPLKISKLPNIALPVITVSDEVTDDSQLTAIDPIVNTLYSLFDRSGGTNLGDAALSNIKATLMKSIHDEALVIRLISGIIYQYKWEHATEIAAAMPADISLLDDDLAVVTKNAIDTLNAKFLSALGNLPGVDNVTLYQHSCEDPLFIALPTLNQLSDEDLQYADIIPDRSMLCDPYTNPIYGTYRYKEVTAPGSFDRILIEGSADNNGKPLYDNEKKFHDALVSWIKYNINENPKLQGGTVIDLVSQSFLRELISHLYMYHWGHNENMPVLINDSYNEESESLDSKYSFAAIEGKSMISSNAILDLISFVSEAAATVGYTAYVDTVIQLCRWGIRKQTKLVIEGFDHTFNLGNNTIEIACAVRGDVKIQKINDCDYSFICEIMDNTPIADNSVTVNGEHIKQWPMATGVLLKSQYVDESGSTFSVNTAISMIDLVREMLLNNMTVDGISVTDGKFAAGLSAGSVTTEEMLSLNEKNDQLRRLIYRSTPLENLYMRLATGAVDSLTYDNQFSIMRSRMQLSDALQSFGRYKFTNYEELKSVVERTCSTTGTVINTCVSAILYDVYVSVASKYSDTWTLADCINAWHDAMIEVEYIDEASFYKETKLSGEPIPGVGVHTDEPIEKMSAFETNANGKNTASTDIMPSAESVSEKVEPVNVSQVEIKQTPAQGASGGISIFMDIPADCNFIRITSGDTVVGMCAHMTFTSRSKGGSLGTFSRFLILSQTTAQTIPQERIIDSTIPLSTIIAHGFNLLLKVGGAGSPQQLYFENMQTIKEIRTICKDMKF